MRLTPLSPASTPQYLLIGILLIATVLSVRAMGNIDIGMSDADRILMDGVFIRDFLADLPLRDIYAYTVGYYAQYPALSIGYRPPLLPLFEGLANGVFGINQWSSRLVILGFWLLGVAAWFRMIRRTHDLETAWWSSLLLVTAPFVAKWAWYTMAELPVLALILMFAASLSRYLDNPSQHSLLPAALLLVLAMWTKQTAGFAAFWGLTVVLFNANRGLILRRRDTWLAAAIALLLILPLIAITVWLGEKHLVQTIGQGGGTGVAARLNFSDLTVYPRALWEHQLGPLMTLLAMAGIAIAVVKRDARGVFHLLWILSVFAVFTYLVAKLPRYTIFWLPPLILFATRPLLALRAHRNGLWLARAGLISIAVTQVWQLYAQPPQTATGYEDAALEVLARSRSPAIFFDGFNNGYFTWFIRRHDPQRRFRVLRGDKLLSSSAIIAKSQLREHVHSDEEILALLDAHGVEYLVVERRPLPDIPIHHRLRVLLEGGRFELVREIPVEAVRRPKLEDQVLLIYRYLDPKAPRSGTFTLHLPTVGQTLDVPIPTPPTRP